MGPPDMSDLLKDFPLPKIEPTIPQISFAVTPIIEDINLQFKEFQEVILPTLQVFQEANLQFEEEFVQAVQQQAQSPPDNWEAYSLIDEIEDTEEPPEDLEDREAYEEEGAEAVAQLTSIDRDTAKILYLRF